MEKRKYPAHRETWGAIRKLPSGRFQASYPGADNVRHTAPMTFDNRGDARTWLSVKRSELARGEWQPSKKRARVTFGDYAREYVATRTVRGHPLKATTRSEYDRLLTTTLIEFRADKLDAITPERVRKWHSSAVATGRRTTAGHAYRLLSAVLTQAVADGLLKTSPATIAGAVGAKTGKSVVPPTEAELGIIVATIDPRLTLLVEIAAWGGLRWGEITELRRKDVQVTESDRVSSPYPVITVRRAVTRTSGVFVVGPPKSAAGIRTVALPPMLTARLLKHLETIPRGEDQLLFPSLSDRERHFHSGSFNGYWRRARAAAGRDDMPFHALRHYGLTRFAKTGALPRELLARAGHSDLATALRYQHESGRDAELAARMASDD